MTRLALNWLDIIIYSSTKALLRRFRMAWWNRQSKITFENNYLAKIINYLVFECPSSIKQEVKTKKSASFQQPSYTHYGVSARNVSFKNREITGHLLVTLNSQIRKKFNNGRYFVLKSPELVEEVVESIINHSSLKDKNFEFLVFKKRTDMSDTEAIYYYVRNAFAHGSFELIDSKGILIYKLESRNNKEIKAQMRLKESTLISMIKFAKYTPEEIRNLRSKK